MCIWIEVSNKCVSENKANSIGCGSEEGKKLKESFCELVKEVSGSMEPHADEAPASELIGVQFSLLASKELLQLSVYENGQSLERTKDLCDPRLGLPAQSGKCYTCDAERTDQCEGHFGHIILPFCLYNPFLIRHVGRLLQKICLNCYKVKKKEKSKSNILLSSEEAEALPCSTSRKRKLLSGKNSSKVKESATESPKVKASKNHPRGRPRKMSTASMLKKCNGVSLEKRKNKDSSDVVNISSDDGSSDDYGPNKEHIGHESVDLEDKCRVRARRNLFPDIHGMVPNLDSERVTRCTSDEDCTEAVFKDEEGGCKYCKIDMQGFAEPYPPLHIKVLPKVVANVHIEVLQMEVRSKARDVPRDFWNFVQQDLEIQQRTRALLPIEAFNILRKIPSELFNSVSSKKLMIRLEDCFIKVLPVPPNCLRIIEQGWNDRLLARLGCDGSTRALGKLLNKVRTLKSAIDEKQFFHMAENDTWELQALVMRYLQTNLLVDEEGESGDSRKPGSGAALKWFRKTVLGKRSNYSSRAVISGDPYISSEEIAIPYAVAQTLTIPEVVNRFNLCKLLQCVRPHGKYLKTGAVALVREGKKFNLTGSGKNWSLKLGDIVHRRLKDGDLVLVNRTPTVHKHSLIAFQVRIRHGCTFSINPITCGPFSADFDGDEMHVYVPQSTEAVAELSELMTIPQQLISSQGGQPIIRLTQDSLLAAHCVITNHIFLSKYEMDQLQMWCTAPMPIPAILQSPCGCGPLWTGKQLFSMCLPSKVNYVNINKGTVVSDGELLVCEGGSAWLQSSTDSLLYQIFKQEGPHYALQHLNQAQLILHEWLCLHGFSIGLSDFYLSIDAYSRSKLLEEVRYGMEEAKRAFSRQQFISDADNQKNLVCGNSRKSGATASPLQSEIMVYLDPKDCRSLEKIKSLQPFAMDGFQRVFNDLEKVIIRHISSNNSLLRMVRAGSKGSVAKIVHQSGCLGIQPYRGEEWLLCQQHKQLKNYSALVGTKTYTLAQVETKGKVPLFTPMQYWRFKGLVENSFLDGLSPHNFFIHSITSRGAGICESIKEPGQLFRRLMNFLQDVSVSYDGTVRNMYGDCIIQFEYGGIKTQKEDFPIAPLTTNSKVKESAEILSNELAGEAVGALAASAVAEPAYDVVLDSPHQVGMKKVQPLTLLQETLLTRRSSKIKQNDRCVILRLARDACKLPQGQEWGVLKVLEHLKPIFLEQITLRTIIEYRKLGDCEVELARKSPWVGCFELQKESLRRCNLTLATVSYELNKKFNLDAEVSQQKRFHRLIFFSSDECQTFSTFTSDPCIYFFPDLPQFSRLEENNLYEERTSYLLETMRDVMIPVLLRTVIKGDPCIESVSIAWEEHPVKSIFCNGLLLKNSNGINEPTQSPGELVLKVLVKDVPDRGLAWKIVQRACLPIMSILDWQRSMPYSIQEVRHSFGIEAAHGCVLERLRLAVRGMGKPIYEKHLTLISDMMVHSGNVTGFTPAGYKELLDSVPVTAPFTRGACTAPRRTFLNSGLERSSDSLQGVIATSAFGKMAHLGTGSDFKLLWQETGVVGLFWSKHQHSHLHNLIKKGPSKFNDVLSQNRALHHDGDSKLEVGIIDELPSTRYHKKPSFELEEALEETWETIEQLVECTRMILHNSKYENGDILEQHDKKTILEEVLHYHPDRHLKIGNGVESIKVDYHQNHGCRCFFVNRIDGSSDDFSFHKCLKELARKSDIRLAERYEDVYFRTST
ncbi:hypothetical protein O6H91_08G040100 [Diphasiastrum complanatum]|uniref:Uncharacterized protein n=1 Tax=Diphasiastrum complanatum TaxID=34168 RepID=A0ACC2CWT4_DIPCM|nr:hypothetical protein O6H91_08G040100 [Diphasiastrum complanatum]